MGRSKGFCCEVATGVRGGRGETRGKPRCHEMSLEGEVETKLLLLLLTEAESVAEFSSIQQSHWYSTTNDLTVDGPCLLHC